MRKNSSKLFALWLVMTLSLLSVQLASAKGPPGKVTIEGPGIDTPIEITDIDTLMAFSFFQFENVERQIEAPAEPGEGFTVTRYMADGAKLIPWDRVIYYPGEKGEAGVVYLEGMIDGWSEYDGYWYRVYPDGEAAMGKILGTLLTASVQGGMSREMAAKEPSLNPAPASASSSSTNLVEQPSSASAQAVGPASDLQEVSPAAYPLGLGLAALLLGGLLVLTLRRRHA